MAVSMIIVFALRGRLMSLLHPEATAVELLGWVRATKPRLILDMRRVSVLDCSGIGLLAALHRVARDLSGDLGVFGLRERPRHLLEACGLLRVLKTFESEEGALADLAHQDDPELYLQRAPTEAERETQALGGRSV